MASVVQFENLRIDNLKKFRIKVSIKDNLAQKFIKKLTKGSIWVSELLSDTEDDKALFTLYQYEDIGIVSSKIEHKGGTRYERKFYLTDLGKKLIKIQTF